MSSQSIERRISDLSRRMHEAASEENFELAARLRNEIEELKSPLVRQPPPGQMGLGTHVPVSEPPKGWKRPSKPSPMTTHVKRGR